MLSLNPPGRTALGIYTACTNGVQKPALKARFVADSSSISNSDAHYAQAGSTSGLDALVATDFEMASVTAEEMTWLYEARLAGKRSRARPIYDALKQSAPHGLCVLCGVRDATTLDHYLPKSAFPSLAVNPLNLMPACGRCNQLKASKLGSTVHAYFDKLTTDVWLTARLVESKPCVVLFRITCPAHWPEALADRARRHFAMLELDRLYAGQASRTLRGDALTVRSAFGADGAEGVRWSVEQRSHSWSDYDPNCWEAAMYRAMAQSSWFCSGGFEID